MFAVCLIVLVDFSSKVSAVDKRLGGKKKNGQWIYFLLHGMSLHAGV